MQEMVGPVNAASISQLVHVFPLSRADQDAAGLRGNSAIGKNGFPAADRAAHYTAETVSGVGTRAVPLLQILGSEGERSGQIDQ